MSGFKTTEGKCAVPGGRFALVVARFNAEVVERLQRAAVATLLANEVREENIAVFKVPGAFELPLVAARAAASGKYDAVIALGAVIRGGTPHFEYVAGACAEGIARVALDHDLPVIFGVLTTDNLEQALARAGDSGENKGADAAMTALEMVSLLQAMQG